MSIDRENPLALAVIDETYSSLHALRSVYTAALRDATGDEADQYREVAGYLTSVLGTLVEVRNRV